MGPAPRPSLTLRAPDHTLPSMQLEILRPTISSWSATLIACLYATWLASYDVIEISSSAGKDSIAQSVIMVGLARACGLLGRVVIVHADLGRVEWPGTRELAERHALPLGCGSSP